MRRIWLVASFVIALVSVQAEEIARSEIPFEFREGLFWIKAALPQSSQPINLLLDTGAGVSVINVSTAQRLQLKSGRKATVRGVEAACTGHWLKRLSVTAAGFPLPSYYLAVDLNTLSASCEEPVDGLLGADFFRNHVVQIDLVAQKLRILTTVTRSSTDSSLPLQFRPCGMRVPVTVNGEPGQWMRLDTGCASSLQWVTGNLRFDDCERQVAIGLTGLSIPQTETLVHLGGYSFTNVPTGLHSKPIFAGESGLLGNGLLSRFAKITIDGKSGRLYLESRRRSPSFASLPASIF